MGQDLKYLITTQKLNVPIYIIHFKEGNSTVFPMLMEDSTYEEISDYSLESSNDVSDFFDTILCGGYYLDYPTQRLFEFIFREKVLTSFAIVPYREICDLREHIGFPILFIGNRIMETKAISENEIHEKLGVETTFHAIINDNKYWSYEDSEISYLKNLNK